MSFRAPKAPPPPPPPVPLPKETQPDIRQQMAAQQEAAAKRKGRARTILTGQLGDTGPAPVVRSTLLGGG